MHTLLFKLKNYENKLILSIWLWGYASFHPLLPQNYRLDLRQNGWIWAICLDSKDRTAGGDACMFVWPHNES